MCVCRGKMVRAFFSFGRFSCHDLGEFFVEIGGQVGGSLQAQRLNVWWLFRGLKALLRSLAFGQNSRMT